MDKIILNARCLNGTTEMAVDNRGRLLPCCYCDGPAMARDPEFAKLLEVSYLKDYNNIEEILATKQWKRFYKRIKRNEGFIECNHVCAKNKSDLIARERTFYSNNKIIHKEKL